MFNVMHLQNERSHKALLAQDLVDKAEKAEGGARPMTREECSLFDKASEEIKSLDAQILAVQAHEQRREASAKLIEQMNSPAGRKTAPDDVQAAANGTAVSASFKIPAKARRTGVLKAFKGADADEKAYRCGKWLRAAILNDAQAAHWCLTNGMGAPDIRAAMGTTSNTDGGFLVPDEFSQTIIDLREMYGVYRRETRVVPMGRDTLLVPRRLGGVTIGPVGENPSASMTQSSPSFNQVQLVAKKCGGLTLMSTEIAEDAVIDLADWLAQEFAYGFANFEDTVGFTGDGTSAHLGIRGLTTLMTGALGLAGAVAAGATHDLFSELDNTDLTTLMSKLPAFARSNAKFYCSALANDLVFSRLKAVAGGNTVQTLQGGTGETYLGFPIVISQVLPAVTTALNAIPMLFFGDLRMCSTMGDRREVRVFPSEHRYMDTDQIGIRGTERFDLVNHDLGTTAVTGPMVALVGTT